MTEPGFTRAVHKKLPNTIWAWKICDPYMGGIPDAYYRAANGGNALWAEYKYLKTLPKRETTKIIPSLSALQLKMLDDTLNAKQQAIVIVGFGRVGAVFETPDEWKNGMTKQDFDEILNSVEKIKEITNKVEKEGIKDGGEQND